MYFPFLCFGTVSAANKETKRSLDKELGFSFSPELKIKKLAQQEILDQEKMHTDAANQKPLDLMDGETFFSSFRWVAQASTTAASKACRAMLCTSQSCCCTNNLVPCNLHLAYKESRATHRVAHYLQSKPEEKQNPAHTKVVTGWSWDIRNLRRGIHERQDSGRRTEACNMCSVVLVESSLTST